MEIQLSYLGFNEKESKVYLYLIEYGISGASEIARHIGYPKSTVNFLADTLWKRGYLAKSIRGNTHYYEADIDLIQSSLDREARKKEEFLQDILPVLKEMNNNIHTKPKILFFDGEDQCKRAYRELLHEEKHFYEFGAHQDLVHAFGADFMNAFIHDRMSKGIHCFSIGTDGPTERSLQALDKQELRILQTFSPDFGQIGSSIAVTEDAVLILNLHNTYTGIHIRNREFAQTLQTIFRICLRGNEE